MKHSFFIMGAAALWGMISIFIHVMSEGGLSSMQCVAVRVFLTAVFLFIYLWMKDRKLLKIKPADLIYFVGTGIGSIVFFNYCYFKCIEMVGGAAVPALLLYTAPMFVIVLSAICFHEKITLQKIAALIITFVGLGFITGAFTGQETLSISAFLFGLGSGLGYGLYSIFGKMVVDRYASETITFYTFFVATVGALPISGIFGKLSLLWDVKMLAAGVGLTIASTILPFLLYTWGLAGVEAGKASILATVEPFVASIVGLIFFQEKFTFFKVLGMVMVAFAVVFASMPVKKRKI